MISRRKFLQKSLLCTGVMIIKPWLKWKKYLSDWPEVEMLGRNCVGGMINIRLRPSASSPSVGVLYEDAVIIWLHEVVGEAPGGLISRRWVETPDGYIYAPVIQPVRNMPNEPVIVLPESSSGRGMWAEVTVPFIDISLENPPNSEWLKNSETPRLYYSQVLWIDDINTNAQGQVMYRVNEKFGNPGDVYWAAGEAFRPITEEDISPIHQDAIDKRIIINLNYQTLSCFEGNQEVYFCRISSGAKFDAAGNVVDHWSTPIGAHLPWRKLISLHMGGGSIGTGWDTPGIGWTTLFDPDGAAIHSTFWHNDFGVPRSHGCVNTRPEDAKYIFRWSSPYVPYDPGNIDMSGPSGTVVEVVG